METTVEAEESRNRGINVVPQSLFTEEQWEDIARDTRTPQHVLDAICDWGSAYLQHLAIANPSISRDTLTEITFREKKVYGDSSPSSAASHFLWKRFSGEMQEQVISRISKYVLSTPKLLYSLAMDEETPSEILDMIAWHCDEFACEEIIKNPQSDPHTLAFLVTHPEKEISDLAKKKLKEKLAE